MKSRPTVGNPKVNANGKLYGSPEDSTDYIPIFDPAANSESELSPPVRDPNTPDVNTRPHGFSSYWGPNSIWDSKDHHP